MQMKMIKRESIKLLKEKSKERKESNKMSL